MTTSIRGDPLCKRGMFSQPVRSRLAGNDPGGRGLADAPESTRRSSTCLGIWSWNCSGNPWICLLPEQQLMAYAGPAIDGARAAYPVC